MRFGELVREFSKDVPQLLDRLLELRPRVVFRCYRGSNLYRWEEPYGYTEIETDDQGATIRLRGGIPKEGCYLCGDEEIDLYSKEIRVDKTDPEWNKVQELIGLDRVAHISGR